jgi:predicted nucleotidyltransferase component of viral defense system
MHSAIESMLQKYQCRTIEEYKNALNEIVQEIALLGLYRGGFFTDAAFYGGTALRIFHGLERFSEDLDFSLLVPNKSFDLSVYLSFVRDELGAYGLEMTVEEKVKQNDSPVRSAFIKGGTQIHLMKISSLALPVTGMHANDQIKIKFEVDTNPPAGADVEIKYQLVPLPYSIKLYDLPSLFAGKVHAVLCRKWKTRVKGRDFYDYQWYLSKGVAINLTHLTSRMRQSGYLSPTETFDADVLRNRLQERFESVDFDQAKKDVISFIKDPTSLDLWSPEFFISITRDRLRVL